MISTISQDLILHGGSGLACGGSFNLERGGKEKKEVKVPTTATLTKPLLPGSPSRRGHSPTSKQACGPIVPAAGENRACLPPGRIERACRRGGQSVHTAGEDRTPAVLPAAGEDVCYLPMGERCGRSDLVIGEDEKNRESGVTGLRECRRQCRGEGPRLYSCRTEGV